MAQALLGGRGGSELPPHGSRTPACRAPPDRRSDPATQNASLTSSWTRLRSRSSSSTSSPASSATTWRDSSSRRSSPASRPAARLSKNEPASVVMGSPPDPYPARWHGAQTAPAGLGGGAVVLEGLHGRLDQDADADGDAALVHVEGGGVDVEVGPGDADAQAGHGAGDLLQVPGEVLPAHALGGVEDGLVA